MHTNNTYKTLSVLCLAALIYAPAFASANAGNNYAKVPNDISSSELWKDSWNAGSQYEHLASYDIRASIKPSTKEDTPWLTRIFSWATSVDDIGNMMSLSGNSRAFSSVLSKSENGEPIIFRTYTGTRAEPNFYWDTSDAPVADFIMKKIEEDGEVSAWVNKWTETIATWGAMLIPWQGGKVVSPSAKYFLPMINVGQKTETYVKAKFREMGFESATTEDGQNAWRVKNKDTAKRFLGSIVDKVNTAVSFSHAFEGKNYLIICKGNGEVVSKEITEKNAPVFAKLTSKGISPSDTEILENIEGEPAPEAASTFKREAWGVNEKIFGGRERKVGDIWEADADFLNSFLHPDLCGRFEGSVVLQYQKDTKTVIERDGWESPFMARKIVLLSASGDKQTDARYLEADKDGKEKFSVKLDGRNTLLEIYLEQDSLLVRRVFINATRARVSDDSLPETFWTKGLCADGDVYFTVNYYCREKKGKTRNAE